MTELTSLTDCHSLEAQVKVPCKKCGIPVDIDPDGPVAALAKRTGVYCVVCMEEERRIPMPSSAPLLPFSRFCPPCFEDTDTDKLPCPVKSARMLLDWKFGTMGLNAWGYAGTGKTRTMSILVRRLYDAGKTIVALAPGDFERECHERRYRRGPWLEKLARVDVLFLDDYDKMNLTREMEKSLFAVLNKRMGRKPVLLTHNSNARQLEYHFSLGTSIVRRIRDTCLSVHFGQEDICKRNNGSLPLPP